MKKTILSLLLFLTSFLQGDDLKDIIKKSEEIIEAAARENPIIEGKCQTREVLEAYAQAPKFLIFMSFSVPEDIWFRYDKDLHRLGGSFVIRGLPKNSADAFVKKIRELKKRGLISSIIVDPLAFRKYGITVAPSFVVDDGRQFDTMKGATSLRYVIESFVLQGKTRATSRKFERIFKKIKR